MPMLRTHAARVRLPTVEHETQDTATAVDSIFRRLAEIFNELGGLSEADSSERQALEAERARLRRRAEKLAGSKLSHRSLESLQAEVAAHRERLYDLKELKIRDVGLTDSIGTAIGTRATTKASIASVNAEMMTAGDLDGIGERIDEIVEELLRRGEPTGRKPRS